MTSAGLLDTSVFIARESGRALQFDLVPDELFVSVVTMGELEAGVLAARDLGARSIRIQTLTAASEVAALPVDRAAASEWARMRVRLAEVRRRANVNDLWIAAIAAARRLPVVTQDADFDVLAELGLVDVIRV